jgi:hypothetical protein
MTQINHVFGKTLEFSTTVNHGRIVGQELVSSNEDSLITFRIDGDNFLCPKVLHELADKIQEAKSSGLALASSEEANEFIKTAKSAVEATNMFNDSFSTAYLAVAECNANRLGLTLYESRVTEVEVTEADLVEEEDLDDVDADYEEDEWDDDYYDDEDEDDDDE